MHKKKMCLLDRMSWIVLGFGTFYFATHIVAFAVTH